PRGGRRCSPPSAASPGPAVLARGGDPRKPPDAHPAVTGCCRRRQYPWRRAALAGWATLPQLRTGLCLVCGVLGMRKCRGGARRKEWGGGEWRGLRKIGGGFVLLAGSGILRPAGGGTGGFVTITRRKSRRSRRWRGSARANLRGLTCRSTTARMLAPATIGG